MARSVLDRRQAMASFFAVAMTPLLPAVASAGSQPLSPLLEELTAAMRAALVLLRTARAEFARTEPALRSVMAALPRGERQRWYYRQEAPRALNGARRTAEAAIVDVMSAPLSHAGDKAMQLHAVDLYEVEIGDVFQIARRNFAPETMATRAWRGDEQHAPVLQQSFLSQWLQHQAATD